MDKTVIILLLGICLSIFIVSSSVLGATGGAGIYYFTGSTETASVPREEDLDAASPSDSSSQKATTTAPDPTTEAPTTTAPTTAASTLDTCDKNIFNNKLQDARSKTGDGKWYALVASSDCSWGNAWNYNTKDAAVTNAMNFCQRDSSVPENCQLYKSDSK
jgi:hypothetical protein